MQGVLLAVDDVQMAHGYVLHVGRTGRHKISVGDIVSIAVNSVRCIYIFTNSK